MSETEFDIEVEVATSFPQFIIKTRFRAPSPEEMAQRLMYVLNELASFEQKSGNTLGKDR